MSKKDVKLIAQEIYNDSLWIFEKQDDKTSFHFVEDCYNNIKLNEDITKTIFEKNTNDIKNITFYLNKIYYLLPYELDIILEQTKERSLMNLLEASLLLFHTFYPKEFEDLEQKKFQKSSLFAIKISNTLLVQDLCLKYLSEKEKHQVLINDISNLIDKNIINLYNISLLISIVLSLHNLLNTSHLENLKLQLQEIEKDTLSVFDNVNDKFKLLRKIQRLKDFLIFKTDSVNDFNRSLNNAHKLFYLPRLSQENGIIVDLKIKEQTLASWLCKKSQSLKVVKIGRLAKYRMSDLLDFLEQQTKPGCSEEFIKNK